MPHKSILCQEDAYLLVLTRYIHLNPLRAGIVADLKALDRYAYAYIAAMTWPGQFNLDFLGFLVLSGVWLAWRHHFSPIGLGLGLMGLSGGILFLAPYLLIASYRAEGDVRILFLGKSRAL
jgi:hypothetical protein